MDIAEQSLKAIEILSKRHSKSILCAGGIAACLTYLDFVSISAQRSALNTVSNCCYHLNSEEFRFVSNSLPLLAQQISSTTGDKKSVESVCTCFTRLVDNFMTDTAKLEMIASNNTLENMQQ